MQCHDKHEASPVDAAERILHSVAQVNVTKHLTLLSDVEELPRKELVEGSTGTVERVAGAGSVQMPAVNEHNELHAV
ncbi:hypothetical protein PInf_025773 [Phytophthora infestans]|nr:hypothetical protein PInf_025773 [Phytophthora infestans]